MSKHTITVPAYEAFVVEDIRFAHTNLNLKVKSHFDYQTNCNKDTNNSQTF